MDKKGDISKIKKAFSEPSLKAPEGLWQDISKGLDDAAVDEKVAHAFHSMDQTAPADLWDGIAQELVVNSTWKNILGQMRRTYILRSLVQSVLLLVALFLSIRLHDYPMQYANDAFEEERTSEGGLSNEIYIPADNELPPEVISITTTSRSIDQPQEEVPVVIGLSLEPVQPDIDKLSAQSIGLEGIHYNVGSLEISPLGRGQGLDLPTPHSTRFSFTVYGALNNPSIMNNVERIGERSGSLIETELTFNVNYGFTLEYEVVPSTTLLADVNLFKVIEQQYNEFTEGQYVDKSRLMLYNQFSLGASYRFDDYSKRLSTAVNGGLYLSKLQVAKSATNGEWVDISSEIQDWDQGVWFGITEEYQLNRATLTLGLRSQWGVRNLYKGNETIPSEFDHTLARNNMLMLGVKIPFTLN